MTSWTARGIAAATAGVHCSLKLIKSSASTPINRTSSSAGKRAPARRPKAKAVGRLTSCAEALFCVDIDAVVKWWIVPGGAPVQMASITIARS